MKIIRRDCAYCIDMDEQGALCDHPCNLYGGEPIDAECNGCNLYERRLSTPEMLDRIHVLEKRLKESEFWREKYADEIIQLKPENAKLRELVRKMYTTISWCDENTYPTAAKKAEYSDAMRELGIEVEE